MKPRFCGEAWERGDGVSATGLVVATWQEARIRPGSLVLAFWYLFIVVVFEYFSLSHLGPGFSSWISKLTSTGTVPALHGDLALKLALVYLTFILIVFPFSVGGLGGGVAAGLAGKDTLASLFAFFRHAVASFWTSLGLVASALVASAILYLAVVLVLNLGSFDLVFSVIVRLLALFILLCTDTPEMWTPATACFVQESLKATHASAIDLTGGCAGFLQTLELADALARQQKTVMVIGTELLSRSMDWSDRNTAVLFGDGAGAVIVSPGRNVGIQLTHSRTFSDGSQADILQKPYGGTRNPIPPEIVASGGHHRIHMEGKKVFRQAVYRMANAAHQVLQDTNTSPEDIDWVVPHQANQRILDAVAGELHLPTSKVFSHVRHYANTGSASVILALADMILKGLLQPNQRLVSVAFGDGFSWGSALWDVASLPPAEFLGRDM